MLRWTANLLLNVWVAIAFVLSRALWLAFRRRTPIAIRVRVLGELAYLVEPRRRPWLLRLFQRDASRREDQPRSLRALERDLAALATQPQVKAVVLHLEAFEGSGATLAALREALAPFRKAGKSVLGYTQLATTGEYRLLAGLDRLMLAPGARLELSGYGAEVLSLRGALELFGIRPQFVRRGEFKTAPEMFTRESISPAQRQTLDALLDARMEALVRAIAAGRRMSEGEARQAIDRGPYSARRAIESGLADGVSDLAGLEEQLRAQHGEKLKVVSYGAVEGIARRQKPAWRPLRRPRYVAVVPVRGLIKLGEGRTGSGPKLAGSEPVVASLEEAAEDARAKAVLLYIDSGGGSAIASEVIHAAVRRVAKDKPVLAYFDRVAASGGYMAAVGAREVWCAPEAIAGSIGVFAGKLDVQGLLARLAVGVDELLRGAHAGLHSPFRPWGEEERALLEQEVEETYQDFLRIVAEARKRTVEQVHAVGEGRVFTGPRALEAKLVDGLCDFKAALEKATALGGLPPDAPLRWIDVSPVVVSPLALLRPLAGEYLWALLEPRLGL